MLPAMTLRISVATVGAWLVFVAGCGNTQSGANSTSGSSTGGVSTTTGAHSGTSGGINNGTTGSGDNATTSSGTTGGTTGEATSTSGGTGTGTSGSASSGTTTSGMGTSTSSGTTGSGYVQGPPYQGFDGGPINEPQIDQGCTAATPYANPAGTYPNCVSCRRNSDCPAGEQCDTNIDASNYYHSYQCVPCLAAKDCPAGDVCDFSCTYTNASEYYVCSIGCEADCRTAASDFCNPGYCDTDGGQCMSNLCIANANCVVNGMGACDFTKYPVYPPMGIGECAQCTVDAGGCGPDQACTFDQNTDTNICKTSCLLLDGGGCGAGTYCTDAGSCQTGCQTSADCVGSFTGYSGGNICHQGQCVGCLKTADCPDFNAGCNPEYQGATASCGYCATDQDCEVNGANMHCEANREDPGYYSNVCGCHADSECPADAPTCIGLNASAGFPQGSGRCGCSNSNQCLAGFICESRYPYGFTINTSGNSYSGGACIPGCQLVGGTDCASAGIGPNPNNCYPNCDAPSDLACNSTTGYCVVCAGAADCPAPITGPAVAPTCVPYPNGNDPASGEPTGGGVCGCSDTSQCNDGYACWNPGIGGTCQAPCTRVNGVDSCNPFREYGYDSPPTNPFCDTFTGACVQCFDNYGCTGVTVDYINGEYVYPAFPAPTCTPAGQCAGCSSDADCPSTAPNCTDGFCGYCNGNQDCYGDAGFTCLKFDGIYSGGTCEITGCVGDSTTEIATDAGFPCPPGFPYCAETEVCYDQCTFPSICAQCRYEIYPKYIFNDCTNYPPGLPYGYCQQNGTCEYEE